MNNEKSSSHVFFTADTHGHHGNIIKYCQRPFLTEVDKKALALDGAWLDGRWTGKSSRWRMTEEAVGMMTNDIIDNTNAVVGENDTLWHLGDVLLTPKHNYRRRCREYRDRIKCQTINLVLGNHDDSWIIGDYFNNIYTKHELYLDNQLIVLDHYAPAIWNKSHRAAWALYGHSHSSAERWLDKIMPGRRSMDVGVDNAYLLTGKFRPFSYEKDIKPIMDKRPGFSFDHHVGHGSNIAED